VNAGFRTRTKTVTVTKTNYVACAVVGAVALVVGVGLHMFFHSCPEPAPHQSQQTIDPETIKTDLLTEINTDLDNVLIKIRYVRHVLGDQRHYQLLALNPNDHTDFKEINNQEIKDLIVAKYYSQQA
jgi:flagellar basal body-associated protein FliL